MLKKIINEIVNTFNKLEEDWEFPGLLQFFLMFWAALLICLFIILLGIAIFGPTKAEIVEAKELERSHEVRDSILQEQEESKRVLYILTRPK